MANHRRLIIFGEENVELQESVRLQIIHSRSHHFLRIFLESAGCALRHAVCLLPPSERQKIPFYSTINELNESTRGGQGHTGVQFALNSVFQIGQYIRHACSNAFLDEDQSTTSLVGISIGVLPATAVSLTPSVPQLIPVAVQICLVAFQLGMQIQSVKANLDPSSNGEDQAWSVEIPDSDDESGAQDFLDTIYREKPLPESIKAYISTKNSHSVNISGSPAELQTVIDTAGTLGEIHIDLPIYGPYHAPQLYPETMPSQISETASILLTEKCPRRTSALPLMIADQEGPILQGVDRSILLTKAIEYVLRCKTRIDILSTTVKEQLEGDRELACEIAFCGPSKALTCVVDELRSNSCIGLSVLNLEDFNMSLPSGIRIQTSQKPKLAIIGMSGRFPDAPDHQSFWNLLEAGIDLHRKVPKDRFDVEKYYDKTGKAKNTSHTPYGCFIDEPGLFDPRFFNMSPREATQTDPMHRLGLVSAYEALEMAGYVPNRTPSTRLDRIGTFYGQTSDDWREINAAQNIDTYFITGGVRAFAPGRINYFFKFTGPSFSIDTACSSSAAAVQLACTSLWAGDCDTAVVGGLNVMTNSDIFSGLSKGQFLSKTGNCQTYDNDADGYCRGDGIGSLVVKRLEDAEADNDRILAVILETQTNHSANAISITHPHAPTQESLFRKVMDDAGVDPYEVNYVEMHGTGTQAGDSTEMESVTNVFAPQARSGTRRQPLHLGSVKANAGHGEAASGITAFFKCLLMFEKNVIPPHCGIKKRINQSFPQDLEMRNVHIAFKPTSLASKVGQPRRIFVNNFSAAGGNTATLLEEAPCLSTPGHDHRETWIVAVSAKSKSAFQANAQNLKAFIEKHREICLPDLSYTTTARRIHHNYRFCIACETLPQVIQALSSQIDRTIDPIASVAPPVAFTYTGQGSHYSAIGRQLYELSQQFRNDLNAFDVIVTNSGLPSFLDLVTGATEVNQLSTVIIQIGLVCIQMALTRLWASYGVKPEVVIGHSLGEYAALNAAGVLTASETIFLVGERARLLLDACTLGSHAMLATKTSPNLLAGTLHAFPQVEIACINGLKETILSGTVNDINETAELLSGQGTKCTKVNVPYAFHSAHVEPILDDFQRIAERITFRKPSIPLISPLMANVITDIGVVNSEYLRRHAREPVNFLGSLVSAQELGFINKETIFVEIGPHPVSIGFVRSELGSDMTAFPSLRRGFMPYKTISEGISTLHQNGLKIDWNEFHKDFSNCVRMVDLPAYAFDNKNYWIDYTGDWNLNKGEILGLAAIPESQIPKLSTTTVQRVLSEVVEDQKATIVIESDVSKPELFAAISGHIVNGTPLCPSSIYGDMAMTVGEHLFRLLQPEIENVHVNVCDMEVFKPLIANDHGGTGQLLRLTGTANLTSRRATLVFSSGSEKGEVQHAKCHADFGSGLSWLVEWQRTAYLIKGRIESLQQAATSGAAHRMLRGMAYKLFGAFVEYNDKFRGMEEVILDSPELEATASVTFQTSETDGKFVCSPYWIDSVCHLAGFVVNANDTVDCSKQVYVSHGWESMRFAEPLSAQKRYRSYVKMQPLAGNMVAGDVYIFEGDRIIGMCGALKFQCIARSLLNTFLPPKLSISSPGSAPVSKSAPRKSKPQAVKQIKSMPPIITKRNNSFLSKFLKVVADEVGMPVGELADPINFADIGVDSLMSLSISGRVREELEFDCPSSIFVDFATVGALKQDLQASQTAEKSSDGDSTDNSSYDSEGSIENGGTSTPMSPPGTPGDPSDSESLSMIVRQTISDEMDVNLPELMATKDLTTIGMDSLMALSILGMLRERTGLTLPQDLLAENVNIQSIEKALHIDTFPTSQSKAEKKCEKSSNKAHPQPKTLPASPGLPAPSPRQKRPAPPDRQATSILLQGSPKQATKTLFLIPDGGGSPTSYTTMEALGPAIAIWGLTSPYLKTPEELLCGVTGLASKYITEIKRRQPQGPYHLGGWSAGGVNAFEITRRLISQGDVVETLILIDTPCPLIIEPLPGSLHRFFGTIGLLGDGDGALEKLPHWLLPHFAASVHALATYDPQPIHPMSACPRVWAIWCEDGVCKNADDPRPDPYPYGHAQFLLENRTDFGPNLWDEFMDPGKLTCVQMPGNHFTIMKAPHVQRLSQFLRDAMA